MNTGGPAFPLAASTGDSRDGVYCQNGMTLLDWYAGQAMNGWASGRNSGMEPFDTKPESVARTSYNYASAMLAEKARREAVVQESSTTPDDGKVAELEAANTMLKREIERLRTELSETVDSWAKLKIANSELVEALEGCLENLERWCPVKHREARAILSKHKGVA